jgi:2-octaprenyl-6-methoxyphenol hydroxylase
LIAGGGFVGLALAIALRQGLGPAFAVVVADPALGRESRDMRASAIAAGARRMFETIGVWPAVSAEAQPMLEMIVTDSRLSDFVRPVFLNIQGEVKPGEPFAHMVENARLVRELSQKAAVEGVRLEPDAVKAFDIRPGRILVGLSDKEIEVELLVAADGARSRLRALAGISTYGWSYGQSAIVTTVTHEREHQGRAVEHFLPAGPFAILPLTGRRSSIVWTEKAEVAQRIVALEDDLFRDQLACRFGPELGRVELAGPRRAYPLGLSVARRFVAERLALVGDAAHVIHPVAGQGLNMGLRDAAALAEAVVDAARLGLDPGDRPVLERYQRWRRFDTMAMVAATDGLNRLFSNRSGALRLIRDIGLGVVDRVPLLKRMFIQEAAGLVGEVPKLLRGEVL